MKLIVKCPECKQEINTPHHENNRIDYAKQHGDNFTLTCKACNTTSEYHVDDIKAIDYSVGEIIKNRLIIFTVVFIVFLTIGFIALGATVGILLAVFTTMFTILFSKKNNSNKNLTFNKHKLKGRVSGINLRK